MRNIYPNSFIGAVIVIILIIIDYVRKYNTDVFQRRIFLAVLAAAFAAVLSDFFLQVMGGIQGTLVRYLLYGTSSLFLVVQNIAFYLTFVFLDYFALKNEERTRKILRILIVLMVVYVISVLVNIRFKYFFFVSAENYYTPGKFYLLRLAISYFPLALAFVEIFVLSAQFKHSQIVSMIFFGVLTGSGAGLDILLGKGTLIWPCYTAAMLYVYFFIVQSDAKLDSLTGLGNRFSFNEFMRRLSRSSGGESYSIVMIDMDHFKEINDTLGHLEGDNALRDMSSIIKGCVRETDFAARYGGDEFILAVKPENNIGKLMERIRLAIDMHNEKGKRPYMLQMSYGWDVFTCGSGRSTEEFLVHVDRLMYKDKMSKRAART